MMRGLTGGSGEWVRLDLVSITLGLARVLEDVGVWL